MCICGKNFERFQKMWKTHKKSVKKEIHSDSKWLKTTTWPKMIQKRLKIQEHKIQEDFN